MSERERRFYLDDMLTFAENIVAYSEGFNQEKFAKTGLNYDATIWYGALFRMIFPL